MNVSKPKQMLVVVAEHNSIKTIFEVENMFVAYLVRQTLLQSIDSEIVKDFNEPPMATRSLNVSDFKFEEKDRFLLVSLDNKSWRFEYSCDGMFFNPNCKDDGLYIILPTDLFDSLNECTKCCDTGVIETYHGDDSVFSECEDHDRHWIL